MENLPPDTQIGTLPYNCWVSGGKWGFVDRNGKEITPIKYDEVQNFENGLAIVKINGIYGYIDKNGTEFWEE